MFRAQSGHAAIVLLLQCTLGLAAVDPSFLVHSSLRLFRDSAVSASLTRRLRTSEARLRGTSDRLALASGSSWGTAVMMERSGGLGSDGGRQVRVPSRC